MTILFFLCLALATLLVLSFIAICELKEMLKLEQEGYAYLEKQYWSERNIYWSHSRKKEEFFNIFEQMKKDAIARMELLENAIPTTGETK